MLNGSFQDAFLITSIIMASLAVIGCAGAAVVWLKNRHSLTDQLCLLQQGLTDDIRAVLQSPHLFWTVICAVGFLVIVLFPLFNVQIPTESLLGIVAAGALAGLAASPVVYAKMKFSYTDIYVQLKTVVLSVLCGSLGAITIVSFLIVSVSD